ncbi:MAG: pseudaminic acid synthase [Gammaproteobacteria bacterium RIFCSPHIGHO2_12_FULL_38_11]|nr:MAG: pseudaminic acid synthase [Gammaproteobacteria bacterium RIFCSPHIGHO2_12_FULL_38_11]
MKTIQLGNLTVRQNQPPIIVAELSGNHNQSLDRALALVEAAYQAGAHAVKLQTYTADTITINSTSKAFSIDDPTNLWHGRNLYELYQEAHTPWEWHKPIFDLCKTLGLLCFSSPFDVTAVDFLESLDCPCYKIASPENTDTILLKKVAATGKPMIISTGMATIAELGNTVDTIIQAGCRDYILLKCTSAYPADPKNANLSTISHMSQLFHCFVGLSDHTLGTAVAVTSVAFGAVLIEKHFTLSRKEGGVDSAFSLEPSELKRLVEETTIASHSIGRIHYGVSSGENAKLARRSLFIVKDLKAGEVLTRDNTVSKRPGFGIPVTFYETVLGMKVVKDISYGTALTWDLLKDRGV